jgi:hypothetical protein
MQFLHFNDATHNAYIMVDTYVHSGNCEQREKMSLHINPYKIYYYFFGFVYWIFMNTLCKDTHSVSYETIITIFMRV